MVPLNVTKQQYMLAVALIKNLGQLGTCVVYYHTYTILYILNNYSSL